MTWKARHLLFRLLIIAAIFFVSAKSNSLKLVRSPSRTTRPPIRAAKTHEANLRCANHLKAAFPGRKLEEITADAIEDCLRRRLRQRVRIKLAQGYREKGLLESSTVHQEFRVLRVGSHERDVAQIFRGMSFEAWSSGQGARPVPAAMVWIPDSKTPNRVAEVPLMPLALQAFRDQMRFSPCRPYLFPSDKNPSGYQRTLKTTWEAALRRAQVPYFRITICARPCHPAQCRRGRGRVGNTNASPGRRASLQKIFADEIYR